MGTVFGKNITSSSITVAGHKVYYIDSTDAEIVEVQDGSNVKYNAFKYTLSGTPYYYVIDSTHDTWTEDLGAWGYSEVQPAPVLPEVILMAYSGNEWNYPASFNANPLTFVSGEQAQLYIASGTSFSYESDKVYSVGEYQNPSGTTTGRYGFSVVSENSKIGCKNISGGSITIQRMSVYRCSDSTATVVTVYNSSNVAYNAFKFTANNTDYYYVLDGTQTDWTDDLSGIGYSLYVKAWFTSDKSGKSIDTSYPGNSGLLYDSQGAFIDFQSGSTYTTVAVYNTSQQAVSGIDSSNFTLEDNGGGYLSFKNRSSKAPTVLYVEYTVS